MKHVPHPKISPELQEHLIAHNKPLSRREYEAFRLIMATCIATSYLVGDLKDRLKESVPNGWRDARMVETVIKSLMDKLLLTIPRQKLEIIRREMEHYFLYIRVEGAAKYHNDDSDYAVIPRNTLKELSAYAGRYCDLCDKKGKDARKCKLRKLFHECLQWNAPATVGETEECIYQTYGFENTEGWDGMDDLAELEEEDGKA
ncbi:MAG: hypothetical protein K5663_08395 [Clostridiales bacterium]|nr:hypothetical protein [Clostridiales bacterium]